VRVIVIFEGRRFIPARFKDNYLLLEKETQNLAALMSNDGKFLEKTYRHNYKMVRSYVLKNNGNEDDARDIFQEAMMITWLNLKEGKFVVKNEFSLQSYIYQVAKHKWLDKLKSKRFKTTRRFGEEEAMGVGLENIDYIETERKLSYLNKLYNTLDQKCKDILNRFYFDGNKLEEIASALNYDIGSIRTIKYRCMQKLKKLHMVQNPDFFENE
jgi:RNA polymerase sigma factor (sigma-70 family)